jgi:hypothetical protein
MLFDFYVLRQESKLLAVKNQDIAECVALRRKEEKKGSEL